MLNATPAHHPSAVDIVPPLAPDTFSADEGHVRLDLVTRIRRQIDLGLYDEDARVDLMLDRLLSDLQGA